MNTDDCYRCSRAFQSVGDAMLTLIQTVVLGDSWGVLTLPIVDEYPWTLLFFGPLLVFVQLGFMNLILSAIVEKSKQCNQALIAQSVEDDYLSMKIHLLQACEEMDLDGSGELKLDELLKG